MMEFKGYGRTLRPVIPKNYGTESKPPSDWGKRTPVNTTAARPIEGRAVRRMQPHGGDSPEEADATLALSGRENVTRSSMLSVRMPRHRPAHGDGS